MKEPIFDAKKTWKSACTKTQAMLRFRKGGEKAQASSWDANEASILPLDGQLASFEASQDSFRLDKKTLHMPGTREWVFDEVKRWASSETTAAQAHRPLFWLMGSGGTGKTVVSAVLLDRLGNDAVAWHFFRHDNPSEHGPCDILRSLCAMLCDKLPGFRAQVAKQLQNANVISLTDADEVFETLFSVPLEELAPPTTPKVIVLDALDELPKGSPRTDVLALLTRSFATLPSWFRLFVTSRDEAEIKASLQAQVVCRIIIMNNVSLWCLLLSHSFFLSFSFSPFRCQ